jgi:hypothetical protein
MALGRDQLITKIQQVARELGQPFLSREQFFSRANVSSKQILKFFTRWNDAVCAAGLQPLDERGRPGVTKGFNREELIQRVKGLAQELHRDYLSLQEFTKRTGISYRPIHRLFGDWTLFLSEAGLQPHPNQKTKIPDEELFQDFFRIAEDLGHLPSYPELAQRARYSIGVYERRFKTFSKFRQHAVLYGIDRGLMKPDVLASVPEPAPDPTSRHQNVYGQLSDRPVLGEAIDFRGLQHAPVSELGVVFLFGMLAEELGFVVESVQAGFPDCEGKRRLKKNRWQRVRIEFEYRSSNFLQHRHDPSRCDLIVCWLHDWRDCPLEVICLRDFLRESKPS